MGPVLQELVLDVVMSKFGVMPNALKDALRLIEALRNRLGWVVSIQHDGARCEVAKAARCVHVG
jgi:hypothetical protein